MFVSFRVRRRGRVVVKRIKLAPVEGPDLGLDNLMFAMIVLPGGGDQAAFL